MVGKVVSAQGGGKHRAEAPLRILVTGASGFIGGRLISAARAQGHTVTTVSRSLGPLESGVEGYRWALGEELPKEALKPFDWALHLAHDFSGDEGAERTRAGTLAAIEALRLAGTQRQMFFSSLSARPDARSRYGTTKFKIECSVAEATDIHIVRPGLVIGDGGIYGRIRRWVHVFPLVPLPDGGRGKVRAIGIDHLCTAVLRIMASPPTSDRSFNIQDPQPTSLRELVDAEARAMTLPRLIVPIPSKFLIGFLSLAERIRLPLPVKADNLVGYMVNQVELDYSSPAER